jgi:phosphopantothenoylcysteine decarboxylase/phosphopantothenate--cysteine ligase
MGHAIAEAAFKRGAKVLLVSTVESAPHYTGFETYIIETADQMFDQVMALANRATVIIKAAAPADFRPDFCSEQKIKKTGSGLTVNLVLNRDILSELGKIKKQSQILVGFAAETQDLQKNALSKLETKNADMIIGNLVNLPGVGMGSDLNRITIYTKNDSVEVGEMAKTVLADHILDHILQYRNNEFRQKHDC